MALKFAKGSQSNSVYAAEATCHRFLGHRYMTQEADRFITRRDVIEFANELLEAFRCPPLRSFRTGTGQRGWSRPWTGHLCLPRWAWNRAYITHEIAHIVAFWRGLEVPNGPCHTPEFCGVTVALTRHVFGPAAARALEACYTEHHARVNSVAETTTRYHSLHGRALVAVGEL